MTLADTVKVVDLTAKFHVWSDGPCGWVKGNGWETKLAYNEQRAWELAAQMIYTEETPCTPTK